MWHDFSYFFQFKPQRVTIFCRSHWGIMRESAKLLIIFHFSLFQIFCPTSLIDTFNAFDLSTYMNYFRTIFHLLLRTPKHDDKIFIFISSSIHNIISDSLNNNNITSNTTFFVAIFAFNRIIFFYFHKCILPYGFHLISNLATRKPSQRSFNRISYTIF